MKPKIWKSILVVLPCLLAFFLCDMVLVIALSWIASKLAMIPLIGILVRFLCYVAEDIPWTIYMLSAFLSVVASSKVAEWLSGDSSTAGLAGMISAILLAILYAASLVVNLLAHDFQLQTLVNLIAVLCMAKACHEDI